MNTRYFPAIMATHFDLHGRANGWMPRGYGAWLMPPVALALWAMLRFARVILPASWRTRVEGSPLATLAAGGVVALGAGMLGGSSAMAVALVAVIVSSLVPAVYSYVLARSTT